MVMIINYRPAIEDATEKYNLMVGFYDSLKCVKKGAICLGVIDLYRGLCREAFEIPLHIREAVPGMNGHLEKMLQEGYLRLKDKELSFDPVTMKARIDSDLKKAFNKAFKKA